MAPALASCSLGLQSVPPTFDPIAEPKCEEHTKAPETDLGIGLTVGLFGVAQAVWGAFGAPQPDHGWRKDEELAPAMVITGAVVAATGVAFLVSSRIGYSRNEDCRVAYSVWRGNGSPQPRVAAPRTFFVPLRVINAQPFEVALAVHARSRLVDRASLELSRFRPKETVTLGQEVMVTQGESYTLELTGVAWGMVHRGRIALSPDSNARVTVLFVLDSVTGSHGFRVEVGDQVLRPAVTIEIAQ